MAGFPPAKGNQKPSNPPQVTGERGPISTGKGGLSSSLRVKAAGTKNIPGADKNVNQF